jgi:hypothetical protein
MEGMKGPSWHHLHGSRQSLSNGSTITIDNAYLRESILNPAAATRKGFLTPDSGLPPYAGILNPSQIDSIILFIRSLAKP